MKKANRAQRQIQEINDRLPVFLENNLAQYSEESNSGQMNTAYYIDATPGLLRLQFLLIK